MSRLRCVKPRLQPAGNPLRVNTSSERRIRGSALMAIIERIKTRDQGLCQQCKADGRVRLGNEVDHRVPLHLGGSESDDNRWLLCADCHAAKTKHEATNRRDISDA